MDSRHTVDTPRENHLHAMDTPSTPGSPHHEVQIDGDNILPVYNEDRKEGGYDDSLEKTESPIPAGATTEDEANAFDGKLTFDNFFERYRNWIRYVVVIKAPLL
jgi:hypothetical protein